MKTELRLKRPTTGKAFLLAALCACAANIHAQPITSFPWTETFEAASPSRGDWTQFYEVGNMSWTFATDATTGSYTLNPYQGSLVANYPANSWNGEKTKLISPVLDLTGVTNPSLSFYFVNPYWGSEQNILRILYRTSEASPWNEIAVFDSDVSDWTSSGAIALPNASATYQIALQGDTYYGYSIMVDQLVVAGSLGVEDFNFGHARVYPNPSRGITEISSVEEITSVTLFDMLGQPVMEKGINANRATLDLSALATGNYFVRINTPSASETVRLVKE